MCQPPPKRATGHLIEAALLMVVVATIIPAAFLTDRWPVFFWADVMAGAIASVRLLKRGETSLRKKATLLRGSTLLWVLVRPSALSPAAPGAGLPRLVAQAYRAFYFLAWAAAAIGFVVVCYIALR